MTEYVRLVVERYWLDDDGTVHDVVAVKSGQYMPRALTGYDNDTVAEWVWSLITRSAFETDSAKDGEPPC